MTDMVTLDALHRAGVDTTDSQRIMLAARRDQDRRREGAARPRRRDRRRDLRAHLRDPPTGRARARGRRRGDAVGLRAGIGAGRGRQRRSPATAATRIRTSSAIVSSGRATRRSSTSSTRSWATGRATTARSVSGATPAPNGGVPEMPRVARRGDRSGTAGRDDRPDRRGLADGRGARASRTRSRFGLQFGHGLGVGLYEAPMISRLHSLRRTQSVIEEGMVFALETYCPASDGRSAARIEEEVVVTPTAARCSRGSRPRSFSSAAASTSAAPTSWTAGSSPRLVEVS